MVPPFIPLAIFATIIFGLSSIGTKLLIPKVGGGIQLLVLQMVLGIPLMVVGFVGYVLFQPIDYAPLFIPENFFLLVMVTIFSFMGFVCLNIGLRKGDSSVAGVVLSSRVMITIPLAVIFVGEIYSLRVYVFIFIAFIGAVLVSYREELPLVKIIKFKAAGLRWFFGTIFFWALGGLFIRLLENNIQIVLFITVRQVFYGVFAIFTYIMATRYFDIEKPMITRETVGLTSLYMVFILLAQIAFVWATGEALTLTDAITSFQGVITLMVGLFIAKFVGNSVLKEPLDKKSITIRVIGALFATGGTLGVVLSTV